MPNKSHTQKHTNLSAYFFTTLIFFTGIGSILLSSYCEETRRIIRASLSRELGAFLVVGAVLHLFFELFAKRALTDELFEKIGMALDLATAGILRTTPSFQDPRIEWNEYFNQSHRLDIWVSYASTWRINNLERLRELLSKDGARIRLALPNPDDQVLASELANRFETTPEEFVSRVRTTVSEFRGLARAGGKLQIYFCPRAPLYTFYKFDNVAVLAFFNHRRGRISVPTFVCSSRGNMYQYLVGEFEALIEGGHLAD